MELVTSTQQIINNIPFYFGTVMNGIDVVLFILISLATVGLALFYRQILKPNMILHWWHIFLKDIVPQYVNDFWQQTKLIFIPNKEDQSWLKVLYHKFLVIEFVEALSKEFKNTILYPFNLAWHFVKAVIWYCVFSPILLLALFVLSLTVLLIMIPIKWLSKPLGLCIHCNIFWLSALVYWGLYGINIYFFAFIGITYLFLYLILLITRNDEEKKK